MPRGDDTGSRERLEQSLTHSMLRNSIVPLGAGVLISLLVVGLMWRSADQRLLLGWLALKLATATLRLAHVYRASDGSALRQDLALANRLHLALLIPDSARKQLHGPNAQCGGRSARRSRRACVQLSRCNGYCGQTIEQSCSLIDLRKHSKRR